MIIFNNGKTFEIANPKRSAENIYGAQRSIMEISVNEKNISEDEVREIFYDKNALSIITITDISETGEEISYEYMNYSLPIYICSYETEGVKTITMKIGQLTATELQQEQLITENEDIQMALIELADLIVGGE